MDFVKFTREKNTFMGIFPMQVYRVWCDSCHTIDDKRLFVSFFLFLNVLSRHTFEISNQVSIIVIKCICFKHVVFVFCPTKSVYPVKDMLHTALGFLSISVGFSIQILCVHLSFPESREKLMKNRYINWD